ncbi:Nucleoside phosphorylase [Planktothrix serta PCC 8927]|uniref:Nucleoside phosphorylase n=1 Tax=Planktothrix serta PCC 8927 TaxID=671068 RepID=A0A7Z9BUC5_9CYAN|nr:hypothetical protein [Planktothrix serta]VXD22688.1 Nucleoside phosphorylase [Planktothrix serta PCC 8927]
MQPLNFILVPQGQEYQAVIRGLQPIQSSKIEVLPIPIGGKYLSVYLKEWLESEAVKSQSFLQVLVLGLCGSLSPKLQVGDIVVYQNCLPLISQNSIQNSPDKNSVIPCDFNLTLALHHRLIPSYLVWGLTTERVIITADEKQKLGQLYPVQVVDMEGIILLEILTQAGIKVAIVRVVSDDYDQNLPDLTPAISCDGKLQTIPLLKIMLKHPFKALKLIRSALKSLQILQQITGKL